MNHFHNPFASDNHAETPFDTALADPNTDFYRQANTVLLSLAMLKTRVSLFSIKVSGIGADQLAEHLNTSVRIDGIAGVFPDGWTACFNFGLGDRTATNSDQERVERFIQDFQAVSRPLAGDRYRRLGALRSIHARADAVASVEELAERLADLPVERFWLLPEPRRVCRLSAATRAPLAKGWDTQAARTWNARMTRRAV